MDDESLSPAEVAAFLDGRLEGEELARIQAYLADHPEARQELIKASRIASTAPAGSTKSPRRWIYATASVATAAAVLLAIQPRATNSGDSVSTERHSNAEGADRIELVSPSNGQQIDGTPAFTWHRYDDATYTFVIADESGQKLFEKSTTDTTITVSASAIKGAVGKLYWSVDAQGDDASSLTSGASEFELRKQ